MEATKTKHDLFNKIVQISNGIFTLTNTNKVTHRTFQIKTVRSGGFKGKRLVCLLTGQDNVTSYTAFAFVGDYGFSVFKKYQGFMLAESQHDKLAKCLWSMMTKGDSSPYAAKGMTLLESKTCRRCNRLLTDPTSIKLGIGPECAGLEKDGI
jgi:hypothetical protein